MSLQSFPLNENVNVNCHLLEFRHQFLLSLNLHLHLNEQVLFHEFMSQLIHLDEDDFSKYEDPFIKILKLRVLLKLNCLDHDRSLLFLNYRIFSEHLEFLKKDHSQLVLFLLEITLFHLQYHLKFCVLFLFILYEPAHQIL